MTDCIRTQLATAYKNNHRQLYFTAYKIVRDGEAARDCVAGAYAKVLQNGGFKGDSSLYTYLYQVTKNNALDHVRSHRVAKRSSAAPADCESKWGPADIVPRSFPNPLQVLLAKERMQRTRKALANMKPAKRSVLVMHAYDGLKYREISEQTGAKLGTVMSRINHARAELKAAVC